MTALLKKMRARLCSSTRAAKTMGKDERGLALIEFAYTMPIILSLGMLGTETANYVVTHMKISQVAMQVADSASRVGEQNVLQARQVFEDDINDVFIGAEKLGGRFDLMGNGRIILSSLERNDDGGQWIAWQRCRGAKNYTSTYGNAGDGATGTAFPGMGRSGSEITAAPGTAVMFVELSYTYNALTPFDFLDGREINYTAAFNVRDNRARGLANTNPPEPVANCATFSAT